MAGHSSVKGISQRTTSVRPEFDQELAGHSKAKQNASRRNNG